MDLSTNTWLALLVVVNLVEVAGMIAIAVLVWRETARASLAIEALAKEVRPLLHRTNAVLDDMQDLAARVRRAEASWQVTASRLNETWERAKTIARWRLWPGLALVKGVRAVAAALRRRQPDDDRDADSRFVYEGGIHARNAR